MQITVQMLDGSITPFKVRSSITIASLKAKFEPWQPMKGRALLHHDARLDDRATLGSVPGVRNGTILRVDKHVSEAKNRTTGKKTVMSGPPSSAADEDVVDSIEQSGEDEEMSTEDERRISSSNRKRPLRTSAAAVEDFIDDDSFVNPLRGRSLLPGNTSDDSLNMTETNLIISATTPDTIKKEKSISNDIACDQAAAFEAPNLDSILRSLNNNLVPAQETPTGNATTSTHMHRTTSAVPSHQNPFGNDAATFLAGINAAAAANSETERLLPLQLDPEPEAFFSTRRCNACGRACGCNGHSLPPLSNNVLPPPPPPPKERTREEQNDDSPTDSNNINARRPLAKRKPKNWRAEASWTGM